MSDEIAEDIARTAHAGQVDKAGQPYIGHVERVVANLLRRWPDATDDEVAAAWLHDVIEDTRWNAQALLEAGVSLFATAIVVEVSRLLPLVPYLSWIEQLAGHGSHSAIRVKLADNEDNSAPWRVALIPDGEAKLTRRYKPARALLERGLLRFEGAK